MRGSRNKIETEEEREKKTEKRSPSLFLFLVSFPLITTSISPQMSPQDRSYRVPERDDRRSGLDRTHGEVGPQYVVTSFPYMAESEGKHYLYK